jgi:hypothetical protein
MIAEKGMYLHLFDIARTGTETMRGISSQQLNIYIYVVVVCAYVSRVVVVYV